MTGNNKLQLSLLLKLSRNLQSTSNLLPFFFFFFAHFRFDQGYTLFAKVMLEINYKNVRGKLCFFLRREAVGVKGAFDSFAGQAPLVINDRN